MNISIEVFFNNLVESEILTFNNPPANFVNNGGLLYFDDDAEHFFMANLDNFIMAKIVNPAKIKMNDVFSANIKYALPDEEVELLLSSSPFYRDLLMAEDNAAPSVLILKEEDTVVRIINSNYLRSIVVSEKKQ